MPISVQRANRGLIQPSSILEAEQDFTSRNMKGWDKHRAALQWENKCLEERLLIVLDGAIPLAEVAASLPSFPPASFNKALICESKKWGIAGFQPAQAA